MSEYLTKTVRQLQVELLKRGECTKGTKGILVKRLVDLDAKAAEASDNRDKDKKEENELTTSDDSAKETANSTSNVEIPESIENQTQPKGTSGRKPKKKTSTAKGAPPKKQAKQAEPSVPDLEPTFSIPGILENEGKESMSEHTDTSVPDVEATEKCQLQAKDISNSQLKRKTTSTTKQPPTNILAEQPETSVSDLEPTFSIPGILENEGKESISGHIDTSLPPSESTTEKQSQIKDASDLQPKKKNSSAKKAPPKKQAEQPEPTAPDLEPTFSIPGILEDEEDQSNTGKTDTSVPPLELTVENLPQIKDTSNIKLKQKKTSTTKKEPPKIQAEWPEPNIQQSGPTLGIPGILEGVEKQSNAKSGGLLGADPNKGKDVEKKTEGTDTNTEVVTNGGATAGKKRKSGIFSAFGALSALGRKKKKPEPQKPVESEVVVIDSPEPEQSQKEESSYVESANPENKNGAEQNDPIVESADDVIEMINAVTREDPGDSGDMPVVVSPTNEVINSQALEDTVLISDANTVDSSDAMETEVAVETCMIPDTNVSKPTRDAKRTDDVIETEDVEPTNLKPGKNVEQPAAEDGAIDPVANTSYQESDVEEEVSITEDLDENFDLDGSSHIEETTTEQLLTVAEPETRPDAEAEQEEHTSEVVTQQPICHRSPTPAEQAALEGNEAPTKTQNFVPKTRKSLFVLKSKPSESVDITINIAPDSSNVDNNPEEEPEPEIDPDMDTLAANDSDSDVIIVESDEDDFMEQADFISTQIAEEECNDVQNEEEKQIDEAPLTEFVQFTIVRKDKCTDKVSSVTHKDMTYEGNNQTEQENESVVPSNIPEKPSETSDKSGKPALQTPKSSPTQEASRDEMETGSSEQIQPVVIVPIPESESSNLSVTSSLATTDPHKKDADALVNKDSPVKEKPPSSSAQYIASTYMDMYDKALGKSKTEDKSRPSDADKEKKKDWYTKVRLPDKDAISEDMIINHRARLVNIFPVSLEDLQRPELVEELPKCAEFSMNYYYRHDKSLAGIMSIMFRRAEDAKLALKQWDWQGVNVMGHLDRHKFKDILTELKDAKTKEDIGSLTERLLYVAPLPKDTTRLELIPFFSDAEDIIIFNADTGKNFRGADCYAYIRYEDSDKAHAELLRVYDPPEPHKLRDKFVFHVSAFSQKTDDQVDPIHFIMRRDKRQFHLIALKACLDDEKEQKKKGKEPDREHKRKFRHHYYHLYMDEDHRSILGMPLLEPTLKKVAPQIDRAVMKKIIDDDSESPSPPPVEGVRRKRRTKTRRRRRSREERSPERRSDSRKRSTVSTMRRRSLSPPRVRSSHTATFNPHWPTRAPINKSSLQYKGPFKGFEKKPAEKKIDDSKEVKYPHLNYPKPDGEKGKGAEIPPPASYEKSTPPSRRAALLPTPRPGAGGSRTETRGGVPHEPERRPYPPYRPPPPGPGAPPPYAGYTPPRPPPQPYPRPDTVRESRDAYHLPEREASPANLTPEEKKRKLMNKLSELMHTPRGQSMYKKKPEDDLPTPPPRDVPYRLREEGRPPWPDRYERAEAYPRERAYDDVYRRYPPDLYDREREMYLRRREMYARSPYVDDNPYRRPPYPHRAPRDPYAEESLPAADPLRRLDPYSPTYLQEKRRLQHEEGYPTTYSSSIGTPSARSAGVYGDSYDHYQREMERFEELTNLSSNAEPYHAARSSRDYLRPEAATDPYYSRLASDPYALPEDPYRLAYRDEHSIGTSLAGHKRHLTDSYGFELKRSRLDDPYSASISSNPYI